MTEQRLQAVRSRLKSQRLDALLVTFLPHVRYLSGFSGSNGICVITQKDQIFLTDGRYKNQILQEVEGYQTLVSSESLFEEITRRKLLKGLKRIGIEAHALSVSQFRLIKKGLSKASLVETNNFVEEIASVKEEWEIASIRRAVEITEKVFQKILESIMEGVSELDVAAEISFLNRKYGAEADAFEAIVASGERGAFPHARASEKKIRRGELVTVDMGCRYQGYHSDLTRTVSVGNPSSEARRIYEVVRDAQSLALRSAKSGMKAKSLDTVARTHIRRHGFGRYFSHSLGHGLGLQVHEMPRVSSLSRDVLITGNVITIEPGIYVPGIGGVRIEDDVVIRNGQIEILTTASRDLLIL
jgi:Xaa-Pro aminopeptidase